MKIYLAEEVGSVAILRDGKVLYAPMNDDNVFDTENGEWVEHEPSMDDEPIGTPVSVHTKFKTLGELDAHIRKELES